MIILIWRGVKVIILGEALDTKYIKVIMIFSLRACAREMITLTVPFRVWALWPSTYVITLTAPILDVPTVHLPRPCSEGSALDAVGLVRHVVAAHITEAVLRWCRTAETVLAW